VERNSSTDRPIEIRAEHVNAFVGPTLDILKRMGRVDASVREVRREKENNPSHPISIVIGFSGDLNGSFIIGFDKVSALAVTAGMMGVEKMTELNSDCQEALAEFSNVIVGNATGKLADLGIQVTITTPIISMGMIVPLVEDPFIVPLNSDKGDIELGLSFKGKSQKKD